MRSVAWQCGARVCNAQTLLNIGRRFSKSAGVKTEPVHASTRYARVLYGSVNVAPAALALAHVAVTTAHDSVVLDPVNTHVQIDHTQCIHSIKR